MNEYVKSFLQAGDDLEREPNMHTVKAYGEAWDEFYTWLHNNSEDGTDKEAQELIEQGLLV